MRPGTPIRVCWRCRWDSGRGVWNFNYDVSAADVTHLIRLPGVIKILVSPDEDQSASGIVTMWAGVVERY